MERGRWSSSSKLTISESKVNTYTILFQRAASAFFFKSLDHNGISVHLHISCLLKMYRERKKMQGRACPSPAHHLANPSRCVKGKGFILARAGASRGQGAARETRGRKRPRERRSPPPLPHTPARRRAAEGPPQGAEGGAGCPRPSPARGGSVSGLKDAAAAPRPPARGATKGRPPPTAVLLPQFLHRSSRAPPARPSLSAGAGDACSPVSPGPED